MCACTWRAARAPRAARRSLRSASGPATGRQRGLSCSGMGSGRGRQAALSLLDHGHAGGGCLPQGRNSDSVPLPPVSPLKPCHYVSRSLLAQPDCNVETRVHCQCVVSAFLNSAFSSRGLGASAHAWHTHCFCRVAVSLSVSDRQHSIAWPSRLGREHNARTWQ